MPPPEAVDGAATEAARLEHQVRARIESMSYLPTTVSVAMKFVELGKNSETEPAEYAKVIASDSSLSTKLLSLANSSWFGVRNKVTKVHMAVNLLGLGTVRTLAISYCATGLHHELRLDPKESRLFWTSCLCKAVAAKQYAALSDPKCAEEAFAAGLFQDFALPVMYAAAREPILAMLQNVDLDWRARLQRERTLFRLDHAELARCIAQKLEVPDLFVDAVAFHHNHASLREFLERPALADATYVASLFPHLPEVWNRQDAEELQRLLTANTQTTPQAFLDAVQQEFNQLYGYFEHGDPPESRLSELLEAATRETADHATRLAGTVHELMQQAAATGRPAPNLARELERIEEAATHDPLTGALNRPGFHSQANELLAKAFRYGIGFAVAVLDVDAQGQAGARQNAADSPLKRLVAPVQTGMKQWDLLGRTGDGEFVLWLNDYALADAVEAVKAMLARASAPGGAEAQAGTPGLSAGLIWVQPRGQPRPLEQYLADARALMAEAKRAGGRRLHWQAVQDAQKGAA